MSDIVQQFAMSHGLNFLFADIGVRRHVSRRVTAALIAGAGPVLPHVETEVDGLAHEGYQIAGTGVQVAVGAEVRISRRLSVLTEYKWTRAVMRVSVVGGHASLTPSSHHVVVGLAVGSPPHP